MHNKADGSAKVNAKRGARPTHSAKSPATAATMGTTSTRAVRFASPSGVVETPAVSEREKDMCFAG
jgi:hypothetical protein